VYLQKFNLAGVRLLIAGGRGIGIAYPVASREAGSEYTSW
jgi:hypothetical protein